MQKVLLYSLVARFLLYSKERLLMTGWQVAIWRCDASDRPTKTGYNFLHRVLDNSTIAKGTGLTEAEIEQLRDVK